MQESNINREEASNTNYPSECEVLIVGAGVSGASTLYQLHKAGVKGMVILDAGQCGQGSSQGKVSEDHAFIREDDIYQGREFQHARKSGTAVLDKPASRIKMMVNIYPCTSEYFMSHHGEQGARRYLKLCYEGLQIQKQLARLVFKSEELEENLLEKGSLQVGVEKDEEDIKEEFETLKKLGFVDIQLWGRDQVEKQLGKESKFTIGLYYPHDAIINSQQYSANLVNYVLEQDKTTKLFENCSQVTNVQTINSEYALTTLQNGCTIKSKYVVLCTGGLFTNSTTLCGIFTPCFSYLVSMKEPENINPQHHRLEHPNSMNYFTWGFTHDWCLTQGHIRLSGQDHFSAFKPPREDERCGILAKWIIQKFPYMKNSEMKYETKYGVYSETPDKAPLVGTVSPSSKICYVVGCNAQGQSSLTYCATLVPGLLGYKKLDSDQKDIMKLVTIRRFALLNDVLKNQKNEEKIHKS
ncbi:FAD-dependent oxidoreductase (macronuclear) [Tetrahymena thermophila SB210]|uniref:FAD-dependent oxidoreductase n=1 Tax=Tetrahymena thermophila (strain SB210) TaxID=312017 RepID=I7MDI5_TETTS|nr:FAD-dependent oxidoreductase [Tetrahymena thermophila SB210]EAR87671.1 FAD-dependent oxidoreductase [Tetrahymena thermophila SB210]|eukprot:XP_001007916.1 FAD-dependent oxidoreductase [Tetrahymena thermophila SB210]